LLDIQILKKIQNPSHSHSAIAIALYFASAVDLDTVFCFFDF